MRNVPTMNKSAVTAAPTHTSRQATFTSGKSLKISAKAAVSTTAEMTELMASRATAEAVSKWLRNVPAANSQAVITRDSRSTKPVPTTTTKDQKRATTISRSRRAGLAA